MRNSRTIILNTYNTGPTIKIGRFGQSVREGNPHLIRDEIKNKSYDRRVYFHAVFSYFVKRIYLTQIIISCLLVALDNIVVPISFLSRVCSTLWA